MCSEPLLHTHTDTEYSHMYKQPFLEAMPLLSAVYLQGTMTPFLYQQPRTTLRYGHTWDAPKAEVCSCMFSCTFNDHHSYSIV